MFSEAQIRNLEVRYAGILIQLLATEDSRRKGINHYTLLQEITAAHFYVKGMEKGGMTVLLAIEKSVTEVASAFLKSGECFDNFRPGDIYERVWPILLRNLEEMP